jgi:hypothetical protein
MSKIKSKGNSIRFRIAANYWQTNLQETFAAVNTPENLSNYISQSFNTGQITEIELIRIFILLSHIRR